MIFDDVSIFDIFGRHYYAMHEIQRAQIDVANNSHSIKIIMYHIVIS